MCRQQIRYPERLMGVECNLRRSLDTLFYQEHCDNFKASAKVLGRLVPKVCTEHVIAALFSFAYVAVGECDCLVMVLEGIEVETAVIAHFAHSEC
eukprot:543828-Amphidinium_carterae.1